MVYSNLEFITNLSASNLVFPYSDRFSGVAEELDRQVGLLGAFEVGSRRAIDQPVLAGALQAQRAERGEARRSLSFEGSRRASWFDNLSFLSGRSNRDRQLSYSIQ